MIRFTLFLLLYLTLVVSSHAQQLYISTGFTPPVSDYFERVMQEMDRRMPNIEISFQVLPAERSLRLLQNGTNDGDCCRIPEFVLPTHPELVQVPVSFHTVRFNVFAKAQAAPVNTFEDLQAFAVGTVKGWKAAVDNLQRVDPADLYIVSRPQQLFSMLQRDRLDYAVMVYMSGLFSIKQLGFDDIHAQQPPLIEKRLFLILSKKHTELIPQISETIQTMQADGSMRRIRESITSMQRAD